MITKQTTDKNSKDYEKNLKALAYDICYMEKKYVFGGKNPYGGQDAWDTKKIKIDGIISIGKYYIKGQKFLTQYRQLDRKIT